MCCRRAGGFTLVEMLVAIVIIGVGLAGVLLAFNTAVKSSADPLVHKQMLAVAEELMEEILLKPFAPPDSGFVQSNTTWPVNCGTAAAARSSFDDVSDYGNYASNSVCDIDGTLVAGLDAYSLAVTVDANASLGKVTGGKTKKITVTVRHGEETLTLSGWRTAYACESGATGCP